MGGLSHHLPLTPFYPASFGNWLLGSGHAWLTEVDQMLKEETLKPCDVTE